MLSLVRVLIIGLYRPAVAMGRLPADIGNEKSSPSAGSHQVIWEAVVNIKEHLSEDISAASHFSRLFRRSNGNDDPAVYTPFASAHGLRTDGIAEPRHS